MNYDIIGDIHGHAGKLKGLLTKMEYREVFGSWSKPGHQAIFVGDFVDRGGRQVETVKIVRRMVESGNALAIMGNHEFNAIAWYMRDPAAPWKYLRPRHGELGIKNRKQHEGFLTEVEGTPLHRRIIDWFMTLPLWLDLPELRVIHACWHEAEMRALGAVLQSGNRLDRQLMVAASRRSSPEYRAVECLLKGLEIPLSKGKTFVDKDGHVRRSVRVRWWDAGAITFQKASILGDKQLEEQLPLDEIPHEARIGYSGEKPIFFGHYWMKGPQDILSTKVACVDYSAGKGGPLVAYRWQGESNLLKEHFLACY
jgi:hypothetical protein